MKELIICGYCKGYGSIEVDTSSGRDRDSEIQECDECKGSGRLVQKTTTDYKPFKYNYEKHRHYLKRN